MSQFQKVWAPIAAIFGAILLAQQLAQTFTGNRTLFTGFLILFSLIAIGAGMWNYAFAPSVIKGFPKYRYHWIAKLVLFFVVVASLISVVYIITILDVVPDCCGFVSTNTTPPTPIPLGNEVFEINFATHGEGNCNDYDPQKLGYDTVLKQYYIVPENNGFASVCHYKDNLPPQGSLQTTSFPDGNPSYFGYAVFFGWKGSSTTTTDACGFGVRKIGSGNETIFIQIIAGNWKTFSIPLKNIILDNSPHSIRMVLYPSGRAVGYFDGKFAGENTFVNCSSGPVGFIAYGPGKIRINFVDLKLFNLQ